jgi:hypothetical protein
MSKKKRKKKAKSRSTFGRLKIPPDARIVDTCLVDGGKYEETYADYYEEEDKKHARTA